MFLTCSNTNFGDESSIARCQQYLDNFGLNEFNYFRLKYKDKVFTYQLKNNSNVYAKTRAAEMLQFIDFLNLNKHTYLYVREQLSFSYETIVDFFKDAEETELYEHYLDLYLKDAVDFDFRRMDVAIKIHRIIKAHKSNGKMKKAFEECITFYNYMKTHFSETIFYYDLLNIYFDIAFETKNIDYLKKIVNDYSYESERFFGIVSQENIESKKKIVEVYIMMKDYDIALQNIQVGIYAANNLFESISSIPVIEFWIQKAIIYIINVNPYLLFNLKYVQTPILNISFY